MKKVVRSIIIFLGIVALFFLGYEIYHYFIEEKGFLRLFILYDGVASATTWLDSNADGIKDPDEKPFPNVCVWYGWYYESGRQLDDSCKRETYHPITDENGEWGEFLPGGTCDEVFIFAKVPDGYQATTDLAHNGCWAKFGFVAKDVPVKQKIVSIDEFIRQKNLYTWLTRIVTGLTVLTVSVYGTIWLQKEQ